MTLSFLLALSLLPTGAATPDDDLVGLWEYGASYGPTLEGQLVVEHGENWSAGFGGIEGEVVAEGNAIRVRFAGGPGTFRGVLAPGGRTIDGYWIRRGITEDPRFPGGWSQPFASPLVLERTGPNRWRGEVRPLEDRFELYLRIFREDGRLLGAFRDPYTNDTGGASRFLVGREGDTVKFSRPNDAGGADVRVAGVLQDGRLVVDWADLDGTVELRRLDDADRTMFFPRPPGSPRYAYRKPEQLADGWKTARARDVGMDEAAVERAIRKIIDGDPAARRPALVHSVLVARKGKLVVEEYFFGWTRDMPHDLRSAGKTFSSVMLGAAMRSGAAISPDTAVYQLLAPWGPFRNPDPRKAQITLAHLMTHTSGLDCNDNDETSRGNEDTMQSQTAEPNWWKYTLDLPLVHDPGTRYAYCSANVNLVGAALTRATSTWLPEYFDRTVARPLGFGPYYWNLMPADEGYLGGGAFVRPRDLLKVGQAYLDGGVWRGERIVAKEWIRESTAPRIAVTPETTGYGEKEFGEYYGRGEDALAWHLGALRAQDKSYRTYAATGNGGQLLVVAPELRLVLVFTGGNYGQGGIWSRWPQELIDAGILAVEE